MARLVQVMLLAPTAQSLNAMKLIASWCLYLSLLYVVLCRKMAGRSTGRQARLALEIHGAIHDQDGHSKLTKGSLYVYVQVGVDRQVGIWIDCLQQLSQRLKQ
jgi:hypothetical protein